MNSKASHPSQAPGRRPEQGLPPGAAAGILGAINPFVNIETATGGSVDLIMTIDAVVVGAKGTKIVAAFQDVATHVHIDYMEQLPLYWMASAQLKGAISPNQAWTRYRSDDDAFHLNVNEDITLAHDSGGWSVPSYDCEQYSVWIGFGLGTAGDVRPAFAVDCSPMDQRQVTVAGYELYRSNGAESLGSPVAASQDHWTLIPGESYQLAFDASGVGLLRAVSAS